MKAEIGLAAIPPFYGETRRWQGRAARKRVTIRWREEKRPD
jgi:hypothetical protein